MFFTIDDVLSINKQLSRRPKEFISDELRGWNWNQPPILHTSTTLLTISDIVSLCETGRDIYLRRILKIPEEFNEHLQKGMLIHKIYERAVKCVKKLLYNEKVDNGIELIEAMKSEGRVEFSKLLETTNWSLNREFIESIFWNLWLKAATIYSGAFDRVKSRLKSYSYESIVNQVIPLYAEYIIDGSLIGLSSSIRLDALLFPNIPIEIKVGFLSRNCEIALAGYALAIESQFEIPVNFGILIHSSISSDGDVSYVHKIIPISDQLRIEFIHERDRRVEIVDKQLDPGKASKCYTYCPYYNYCMGEKFGKEKDTTDRRVWFKIKIKER